jgi:hypothetical protein
LSGASNKPEPDPNYPDDSTVLAVWLVILIVFMICLRRCSYS